MDPESWVDKYGDVLYRIALSRLRDANLAEDAVQETFLSALKGRENFQGRCMPQTWFVGILKHKILDQLRKSTRNVMDEWTENDKNNVEFNRAGRWNSDAAPKNWEQLPDAELEQKEFKKVLSACLKHLPEKVATVFTLREIDDIPSKDICMRLDISDSNLWIILYRARKQLRRCLEQNWFVGSLVHE